MRSFHCPTCAQMVFFENDECLRCGTLLGFDPSDLSMRALDPTLARCADAVIARCNWVVPVEVRGDARSLSRFHVARLDGEMVARTDVTDVSGL